MEFSDPADNQHSGKVNNARCLTSEEIVKLVLLSISAHYQRDEDQIGRMLAELKNINQQELVEVFHGLRAASPIEEAVPMLTHWIEAKIDDKVI
jgi:hypothetical protein